MPDLHRSPEVNYMLHCQGCHRPDGSGVPGAVPDLRDEVARFLATDDGRAFLIRVPGVANAPLSDRELGE
ncbi:MAG: c-type cytochrome, partial [Myxococcota bacterium]